ncbi:M12 family metallo-peptidase [Ereboglobus luteus]|uniref:Ig-like domain-containing protein n=1 Tax=Ereboglobus luteus TaxID=1796921 RepID=A0A2U8E187_9BACT|nr:M12 family metallo-peptidase [Ereboglobus luteus]AWI08464.1 hypothetical protein CKA38_03655 [Ereboglobus luteus]
MKNKTRQRLAAGVVMALCIASALCILWQAGKQAMPITPSQSLVDAKADERMMSLSAAASLSRIYDDGVSGQNRDAEQHSSQPPSMFDDAVMVDVREILPNLSQPVTKWSDYTPELLTLAFPGGRTVDYAMTSVREEHGRTIWSGRSDANDASAFLVTVATADTWYVETTDPHTGNNVIYYATGASVRSLVREPTRGACDVVVSGAATSHVADTQSQPEAHVLANESESVVAAASTRNVDVVFFYDQTAFARSGSNAETIKSQAITQIARSNKILENSGVDAFRWNFAGVYQIPAYDSDEDPDPMGALSAMSNQQGTVGSYVYRRAQYHGADQMLLYFGKRDSTYAGMAQIDGRYSVVYYGADYQTLTHELAHNFGCRHDRDESATSATDDDGNYHYGHLFEAPLYTSGTVGTVMSYANVYQGSMREDYFSNPSVEFHGVPTGVPAGEPRAADNARVLREQAATMASYGSVPGKPPFIVTHPRSGHYQVTSAITLRVRTDIDQVFYQWRKDGRDIKDATNAEYKIDCAQEPHAGRYTVHVSNIKGSMTSNEAVIGVGGNNGWGWGYGTGESDLGGDDVSGGGGAPGLYYFSALLMLALFRRAFARGSRK